LDWQSLKLKRGVNMKRMYLLLLPLLALLFLAACESGGNFRVINRTSYPVYVTLDDEAEFAIPAGTEHTFEVATANQHIFNPDVSVEVPVRLVGETFQIYDEGNEVFTDTTRVVIHAGKTTSVFVDPNRASFKVVNNSSQYIIQAKLFKHNFVGVVASNDTGPIAPGRFVYLPVEYATSSNNFYYYATVQMEDGATYNYGNETNILAVDQQFLITLTDPE